MKKIVSALSLAAIAALFALFAGAGLTQPASVAAAEPKEEDVLKVPESLRLRHEAFVAEFTRAAKDSGKVGDAARSIEKLAATHFAKG